MTPSCTLDCRRYLAGIMSDDDAADYRRHVAGCRECQASLSAADHELLAAPARLDALARQACRGEVPPEPPMPPKIEAAKGRR